MSYERRKKKQKMRYSITLTLPPDERPLIQGIRDDQLGLTIAFSIEKKKCQKDPLGGVYYDIWVKVTPGERYEVGKWRLGEHFCYTKWWSKYHTDMYFLSVQKKYQYIRGDVSDQLPIDITMRKIMKVIIFPQKKEGIPPPYNLSQEEEQPKESPDTT